MNKKELWEAFVSRNPSFEEDGVITMSARGLRKMFDTIWEYADEFGQANGRALEKMEQAKRDMEKAASGMGHNPFNEMFGGKKTK